MPDDVLEIFGEDEITSDKLEFESGGRGREGVVGDYLAFVGDFESPYRWVRYIVNTFPAIILNPV